MDDLDLAHLIADASDALTLRAFNSAELNVSSKPDGTVVTNVDLAVETEIRMLLSEQAPTDGVVGEEHGITGGDVRRWFVDPIDGTSSFVAGSPEWATMLALEESGALQVALASSPALGRRWHASRGDGTWARALDADESATTRLAVSRVEAAAMGRVAAWPPPHRQREEWANTVIGFLECAMSGAGSVRGIDVKPSRDTGFPNAGILVAVGALDGFLLCGGGPWDLAPLALLVEEAGGRYSDLSGGHDMFTGAGLFTNGPIHDTLLEWAGAG